MFIEFTDAAIYLILFILHLICGYGVNKDLNEIHEYTDFTWVNLLVVFLWPAFILIRSFVALFRDLR